MELDQLRMEQPGFQSASRAAIQYDQPQPEPSASAPASQAGVRYDRSQSAPTQLPLDLPGYQCASPKPIEHERSQSLESACTQLSPFSDVANQQHGPNHVESVREPIYLRRGNQNLQLQIEYQSALDGRGTQVPYQNPQGYLRRPQGYYQPYYDTSDGYQEASDMSSVDSQNHMPLYPDQHQQIGNQPIQHPISHTQYVYQQHGAKPGQSTYPPPPHQFPAGYGAPGDHDQAPANVQVRNPVPVSLSPPNRIPRGPARKKHESVIKQPTMNSEGKFTCPSCNKTYKNIKHWKRHNSIKHMDERPYQCNWCERTFGRSDVLKRHETKTCNYVRRNQPQANNQPQAQMGFLDGNGGETNGFQ